MAKGSTACGRLFGGYRRGGTSPGSPEHARRAWTGSRPIGAICDLGRSSPPGPRRTHKNTRPAMKAVGANSNGHAKSADPAAVHIHGHAHIGSFRCPD